MTINETTSLQTVKIIRRTQTEVLMDLLKTRFVFLFFLIDALHRYLIESVVSALMRRWGLRPKQLKQVSMQRDGIKEVLNESALKRKWPQEGFASMSILSAGACNTLCTCF